MKKSTERLYQDMNKPLTPKKNATYNEICDRCGKPFTFTAKDVKDRVFKCPFCGNDMVFFTSNYN